MTFQRLLRGVSANREAKYWKEGIFSWDDLERYLSPQDNLFFDQDHLFKNARTAFEVKDAAYFSNLLDPREHYRIPLSFPEKTLFLDIETTGLSRYYDAITLVGWFYQGKYNSFIQEGDEQPLRSVLSDACAIVTFNGSMFDLPFLRVGLADLPIPPVHIDLRFLAKRVALSGGQKIIEDKVGFKRPSHLIEIKGESAPILWHQYRRGDLEALKLLTQYNYCDILGMKFIFDKVIELIAKQQNLPHQISKKFPKFFNRKESLSTNKRSTHSLFKEISFSPYKGDSGPKIKYESLFATKSNSLKVVGIDLTGSENKPSGWCLLDATEATTRLIASDEDLILATLAAQPDIVSIDSPLSLPQGRISVHDDDPGRHQYGIMRYCERVLKKRGINVYPALIPSMQKLTARGIRLASLLRSKGVPVIESYPGAAQDIMGIPRKRASLDMLCEGLKEFGIHGDFLKEQLTHDELDAITSSVVGAFFWSGKFEALGVEGDEALIIPDLNANTSTWCNRRVIGISGRIAAGKTTLARYFETHGFYYIRYSMVLAQIMREQGKEPTRTALQEFGDQIYKQIGQRELGRKLLENLPQQGNIVIDGLRFSDDHAFWIETFGPAFYHVHLEASAKLRKARFETRETNKLSFEEAEAHPVEQQVSTLRPLAHEIFSNEGKIQSLYSKVDHLIMHHISRLTCQ
ncbi:dephospho-CoA kinase [Nitrosomonas sp. PY1]|uniref:dephospho-CoA kinase n=1 Tax=Nitrosomonas sp. PY1 TaxID=1803906 RepID=UPI001FC7E86D|nr:dephospho-CoA kinase [Nitrosomonas sp. PY1]